MSGRKNSNQIEGSIVVVPLWKKNVKLLASILSSFLEVMLDKYC